MVFVIGSPPSSSSASRVVASVSLVGTLSNALPVGREALRRLGGKEKEVEAGSSSASAFPEDKIVIPVGVTPQNLKNYTLYDMLGFTGDWGASADTEVIKKAYHKAVLMYHPDKAQYKTADGKEDRTVFLKIQEAFNVLSSDTKRRAYDSQLPFDETIPSEEKIQKGLEKGAYKFFKIFGPVFKRNARFASKKPVPDLGDLETPIDQVYKFYEYWVHFESWRDFTGVGAEYKPDDAGSREEKRYMQKENERLAKKLKKKEMERLILLVNTAEKYDPRIVADKEAKKAAKDADKNAKEQGAKIRAEENAAATAWNEQQELAAKEKKGQTKEEREKVKKQQSKARNTLKKLLRLSVSLGHGTVEGSEYGIISEADLEILCANCQMDSLNSMIAALGGDAALKDSGAYSTAGFSAVHAQLATAQELANQSAADEQIMKEAKKREVEDAKQAATAARNRKRAGAGVGAGDDDLFAERPWTSDELAAVEKCAFVRYPPGYSVMDRWQMACNYMNVTLKPEVSYKPDEVLRAAHKLSTGALSY